MIRASSRVFGAERALRRLLSILSVVGSAVAFADSLAAQQGTVAGQVLNTASGQPLVAAQVFISDLDLGVLTQPTGRYLILNVPAGSHTVTVQSIGYRPVTAEVTVVAGETVVQNFQISEQAIGLDEIIVTGTPGGTQRRALGNVVSSVNSNAIATSPAGTVEQVLQGRIPNVRLDVGSGLVGADAGPIRIRGSSSIGLSNDPIVYVDGRRMNVDRSFPGGTTGTGAFSRMNDINPADIASIEVIKGPAAATLYGTEAAHGVIQIITKRGASGATRFDASVEYGQNWIPNPEWQSVLPTIWGKNSNGDLISLHLYKQETLRNGGKPLFQNGPIQRYSLSATGGTDRIQYFASINRDDLEGFVDWNTDTKTNARLNLTSNVSETLSFEIQGSYLTGSTRHPGNLWAEFRRGTPNTAADVGGTNPTQLRGYGVRPFEAWRDGSSDILEIERNSWGGTLNWNPVGWLKGRVVLGNDVSEETRNQLVIRELNWPNGFYGQGGEGSKNIDIIRNINRTADASASATLALTDQVGSVTSVGLQYYAKRVRTIASNGAQFALPALSTVSATARPGSGETEFENVTVGAYLQQQFDWQQRIFVTGAVRADDNSAFGAAFDLVYYPKVSATWVLHEESFWNLDFLSQMRLRGAYGQAGKQPGVFASTRLFQPRAGTGDVSYLTPLQFGNPDLGPEKTSELEIGFDAAAFEDRVGIEFTWYSKKTRDAIIEAPVAPSLGFPGFRFVNIGQVSNWGMELALDLAVLQGDQLSADLNISGGTTYSRIDDMGTLSEIAVRRTRRHVEGYPLAAQFERKVVSADWVTGPGGAVTNVQCDGGTGADGRRMGGVPVPCAAAPRVWWGRQSEPTWTMQASPTVTIRQNLRLSALFYAQGGNMVGSDALYNAEIAWVNTYKAQVNDDLLYVAQKSVAPPALGYYNGGYAKLREVSLSYTLPAQLAGRIGASQASVSIAGRNMGILWQEQKLSYLAGGQTGDPEKNNIPTEEFTGEPTSGTMPPSSSIVATVRVSF